MGSLHVLMQWIGRRVLRCLVGKYGTILWTCALALLVGAGAYLSLVYDNAGSGGADQGTVYGVATVDANLAQDPGSWLGRTIQVRGELIPCMPLSTVRNGPCAELIPNSGRLEGYIESASPSVAALGVARGGLDPVRGFLRGIPLVGRLVPAPQELQWGVVATYRVQLAAVPAIPDSSCGAGACAEAKLLDSAP